MFSQYKIFYLILIALTIGLFLGAIHNIYDSHKTSQLNQQSKATYHYNIFTGEQD